MAWRKTGAFYIISRTISRTRNSILIVSFQAEETLGRKLKDGQKRVRIFGEAYDVHASVESIDGYSAHADQQELVAWADGLDRQRLQRLFLVHGETQAAETLQHLLQSQGFAKVSVRRAATASSSDRGVSGAFVIGSVHAGKISTQ